MDDVRVCTVCGSRSDEEYGGFGEPIWHKKFAQQDGEWYCRTCYLYSFDTDVFPGDAVSDASTAASLPLPEVADGPTAKAYLLQQLRFEEAVAENLRDAVYILVERNAVLTAERDALLAQVAALQEALRPLIDGFSPEEWGGLSDWTPVGVYLTLGELYRAAALLGKTTPEA